MEDATGELITFLDADDRWLPGYLESIVAQADLFPECGLFSTGFIPFEGREGIELPDGAPPPPGEPYRVDNFYDLWVGTRPFCMGSCAFRRRWVEAEDLRFPEGEARGEDQDFIFRVADRWPISFDPRQLVAYRRNVPGQLSSIAAPHLPPYLDRLRERLVRGEIAPGNRAGVRGILRVGELMYAHELLICGRDRRALRLLLNPRLLRSPVYWSKLVLSLFLPTGLRRRVLPRHGVRPGPRVPIGGVEGPAMEEPRSAAPPSAQT